MVFVTDWEKRLMAMLGVKPRTARGYAVVITALKYIYDNNEQHFIDLDIPGQSFSRYSGIVGILTVPVIK